MFTYGSFQNVICLLFNFVPVCDRPYIIFFLCMASFNLSFFPRVCARFWKLSLSLWSSTIIWYFGVRLNREFYKIVFKKNFGTFFDKTDRLKKIIIRNYITCETFVASSN